MKPIILFDIDFTLIDSAKLREKIWKKEETLLRVSYRMLKELQNAYTKKLAKSTEFNPQTYIRYLSTELDCKQQPLLDLYFSQHGNYRQALYAEVTSSLRFLKRMYRLGIFTEGFREFQLAKLKLSGLLPFFEADIIFIHRRKLTSTAISRLPKGSIIVDDNPEVISALSKFPHITPIWLNRKDSKKHPRIRTIRSLKELG